MRPQPQPEQPVLPVFLTATEAAGFLRISPVTLSRWRIEGCGSAYRKFGRRVVYAHADLTAWADVQRRASTSEPLQRGDQPRAVALTIGTAQGRRSWSTMRSLTWIP